MKFTLSEIGPLKYLVILLLTLAVAAGVLLYGGGSSGDGCCKMGRGPVEKDIAPYSFYGVD